MAEPLRVGDIVHGHVCGHFGRDHYDCSRVEAIGADWVVMRTLGYEPYPVTGTGQDIVKDCVEARDEASGCSWQCPEFKE